MIFTFCTDNPYHFIPDLAVGILAVGAIFLLWQTIRKGLTYSAFVATIWMLVFVSIGRIFHAVGDTFDLSRLRSNYENVIEGIIYIAGLIFFYGIGIQALLTKHPHDALKKKEKK